MPDPSPQPIERVFLLGAGFSMPAGFPSAVGLTDLVLAPLRETLAEDEDFQAFVDEVYTLQRWLHRGGTPPPMNIEEFYEIAHVVAERFRLEHHRSVVGRSAGDTNWEYARTIDTWLSYLNDNLIEVLTTLEQGARLESIQRWAQHLRPGDAVVTFNYDRLVERCLAHAGKGWSFGTHGSRTGEIPVLKLHGSLDWVCLPRGESDSEDRVELLWRKTDKNRERDGNDRQWQLEHEYDRELCHVKDDGEILGFLLNRYNCSAGLAGLGPGKQPSRIPGLGVVWAFARHAMVQARHVTCVGFSFSSFDRFVQLELAGVMAQRERQGRSAARVTIIDPNPKAQDATGRTLEQRASAIFGEVGCIAMPHQEVDWSGLVST